MLSKNELLKCAGARHVKLTGENVLIFALAYKGKFLYLSDRSDAVKRSCLYSNWLWIMFAFFL